jgi:ABC-type phosphate transport system substrate-binding protein
VGLIGRGLTVAALVTALLAVSPLPEGFKVVVHPGLAGQKIKRKDLAAVYLKTVTRWSDGRAAIPVDQPASSDVRKRFSEQILGFSVVLASQYWLKQMTGSRGSVKVPPPVKESDAAVVAFVKANPGAVGYVSPGFAVGDDVKVVEITE